MLFASRKHTHTHTHTRTQTHTHTHTQVCTPHAPHAPHSPKTPTLSTSTQQTLQNQSQITLLKNELATKQTLGTTTRVQGTNTKTQGAITHAAWARTQTQTCTPHAPHSPNPPTLSTNARAHAQTWTTSANTVLNNNSFLLTPLSARASAQHAIAPT